MLDSIKVLRNARLLEEFVATMLGKDALEVFKLLIVEDKDLTEEEIMGKTELPRNVVRRSLYLLQEYRLVSYKRMRGRESSWYHYYWRVNVEEIPLVLLELKKSILAKLKEKLGKLVSDSSSFACPSCGRKFSLEDALVREFRCEVCGVEVVQASNELALSRLGDVIRALEEELKVEQRKVQGS